MLHLLMRSSTRYAKSPDFAFLCKESVTLSSYSITNPSTFGESSIIAVTMEGGIVSFRSRYAKSPDFAFLCKESVTLSSYSITN
ncbi:MAG: hypothetical protein K2X48_20005, partial [Chitinophagaceae bacterium]|nr:hypothetical protein [Chitinophagaceae bacterium]